jgi:hypothetical protein
MSYISIKNYSQLSKLSQDNVIDMMLQGINFLDGNIITFVSQVKSVEQEIMHNADSLGRLKDAFSKETFKIESDGGIITVSSEDFPPSLFFISNWEDKIKTLQGYTENASVLIPHRAKGSLFISDEKTILRLSDSFEGIYDILSLEDIRNIKI